MGKKNKAPAPPDYTPIANASMKAADQANALAQEQFAWAKQAYAKDSATNDKVVEAQLQAQHDQTANAEADRARYVGKFQPVEDQLVHDAATYDNPARRDQMMGAAGAKVGQAFDAQREGALQTLESYGVNPSATRFGALDAGMRTAEAAAKAGAENTAGLQVDQTARDLRTEAINVGKGYPAQAINEQGAATQAGSSAVGNTNSTTNTGANTMGTGVQYGAQQTNALGGAASALNMGYNNAIAGFNANQAASSGVGSALGLFGGIFTKAIGLASGGTVPDIATSGSVMAGRAAAVGQSNGAIPTDTMGGGPSDVVPARLTPGEFVIPKDTASWLGEKHLHSMIEKSRKDRAAAAPKGALPIDTTPTIPHPAAIHAARQAVSSAGAIPTR